LMVFPAPYLPGPLEGGVEAVNPMPSESERKVYKDLKAEVVTPQSFTGLVNTALIFKLGPQMADLAAEALRRAKYQLRDTGANAPAFSVLYGLAIVAAVTRSEGLAAEVRVLVRGVRRRPGAAIDLSDTLRIALVAAAAYSDIDKWCTFLGEWLTELSYEDHGSFGREGALEPYQRSLPDRAETLGNLRAGGCCMCKLISRLTMGSANSPRGRCASKLIHRDQQDAGSRSCLITPSIAPRPPQDRRMLLPVSPPRCLSGGTASAKQLREHGYSGCLSRLQVQP
jgi:hypothetical protein